MANFMAAYSIRSISLAWTALLLSVCSVECMPVSPLVALACAREPRLVFCGAHTSDGGGQTFIEANGGQEIEGSGSGPSSDDQPTTVAAPVSSKSMLERVCERKSELSLCKDKRFSKISLAERVKRRRIIDIACQRNKTLVFCKQQ